VIIAAMLEEHHLNSSRGDALILFNAPGAAACMLRDHSNDEDNRAKGLESARWEGHYTPIKKLGDAPHP